jgi:hypothetical protein
LALPYDGTLLAHHQAICIAQDELRCPKRLMPDRHPKSAWRQELRERSLLLIAVAYGVFEYQSDKDH